jgi:hypothetical protein
VIDLRDKQHLNALDLMHINSESVSNETEERDLQADIHSEQRI